MIYDKDKNISFAIHSLLKMDKEEILVFDNIQAIQEVFNLDKSQAVKALEKAKEFSIEYFHKNYLTSEGIL